MTDPLVEEMNSYGFLHLGEEKTVTEIDHFKDETEKTELTNSGKPVPITRTTGMVDIQCVRRLIWQLLLNSWSGRIDLHLCF